MRSQYVAVKESHLSETMLKVNGYAIEGYVLLGLNETPTGYLAVMELHVCADCADVILPQKETGN